MQATAEPPPPPPALPPPPRPKRWGPLLGLMAVLLFVTFGGFFFSGVPSGVAGEVELGDAVEVSAGVTIRPADGWVVEEEHVGDPPGVLLSGGNGLLLVGLADGASPAEVAQAYVEAYLEPQATQISVGEIEPVTIAAGPAAIVPYVGVFEGVGREVSIEGEVIGVVGGSGRAVVLDGWTPESTYAAVREQILAMADTLAIP